MPKWCVQVNHTILGPEGTASRAQWKLTLLSFLCLICSLLTPILGFIKQNIWISIPELTQRLSLLLFMWLDSSIGTGNQCRVLQVVSNLFCLQYTPEILEQAAIWTVTFDTSCHNKSSLLSTISFTYYCQINTLSIFIIIPTFGYLIHLDVGQVTNTPQICGGILFLNLYQGDNNCILKVVDIIKSLFSHNACQYNWQNNKYPLTGDYCANPWWGCCWRWQR